MEEEGSKERIGEGRRKGRKDGMRGGQKEEWGE